MRSIVITKGKNYHPLIAYVSNDSHGTQKIEFVFEFKTGNKKQWTCEFSEGSWVTATPKALKALFKLVLL